MNNRIPNMKMQTRIMDPWFQKELWLWLGPSIYLRRIDGIKKPSDPQSLQDRKLVLAKSIGQNKQRMWRRLQMSQSLRYLRIGKNVFRGTVLPHQGRNINGLAIPKASCHQVHNIIPVIGRHHIS